VKSIGRALINTFTNKAPIPYVGRALEGRWGDRGARRADQARQLDAMGASATLFSIVNRTSTAVAKECWHLHRAKPGAVCDFVAPGDNDPCGARGVLHVEKHPALSVLNLPNPFYTTQEYFESGQQHVDLTGEGWTVLGRLGSMPVELWNARPDRMIVVTNRADFLVGYIYLDPDGQEVPIRKEDVMSIRMPNPMDPYRGMGAVQTILSNVDSSGYSAEWNANFFRNGARPGGIVKLSRKMQDEEFETLVERFNFNHRGITNANRTAFLEEGDWVDVKPMNIRDMQFVETAELNRDTILLAFGASKFDVGILEDVNRAASEASRADFAGRMTVPRLDRWRSMLNSDFLPQFPGADPALSFAYSNPVPADREAARLDKTAAVEQYVALVSVGEDPVYAAAFCGLPQPAARRALPAAERAAVAAALESAGLNPRVAAMLAELPPKQAADALVAARDRAQIGA
jgi:HK97 family phage portal protein